MSQQFDFKDSENSELLKRIKEIPSLRYVIDPNIHFQSCSQQIITAKNNDDSKILCENFEYLENSINSSNEATVTRDEYLKRFKFKRSDSLADLVAAGDFERAFYYYQIFYFEEDILTKKDKNGKSLLQVLSL